MHPHTTCKEVNEFVGLGIFASQDIPKGTITWASDKLDICIDNSAIEKLPPIFQEYIDRYSYVVDSKGSCVINWDHTKYMNHCCFANTLCTAYNFDIAIEDIKKGEQITCDYRMLEITGPEIALVCKRKGCLKMLKYDELHQNIEIWDERIKEAFSSFYKVAQPLLSVVATEDMEQVNNFLQNKGEYKSVATTIEKVCPSN